MPDNSKFKRDLPYIKYDRCKSFFMILTDILRKNENYQLQISNNKDSIKCSTYLVPHGTKSQITYYSKPDKSFRFSGHWNWYVPHNLCYNEHYIQCFTRDMPRTKPRDGEGLGSKPVLGTAVCVMGGDGEYHVVYGEVFDRKKKTWGWLETDPADIAEMVCA